MYQEKARYAPKIYATKPITSSDIKLVKAWHLVGNVEPNLLKMPDFVTFVVLLFARFGGRNFPFRLMTLLKRLRD